MTPKLITVQTAAPRSSFPGAAAQAFYIVDGSRVVLTDRDGAVLRDPEGRDYAQLLGEGDNPHQIAGRLLQRFRTKLRCDDRPHGFDGPLDYRNLNFKY
jgi:hypothetical protein